MDEHLHPIKSIDIGVATSSALSKSSVSDTLKLKFRGDCRNFIKATVVKLRQRSPLMYKLARAAACLSPKLVQRSSLLAENRMGQLVQILHENGHIKANSADLSKQQFSKCLAEIDFSTFDFKHDRLDDFYSKNIGKKAEYKDLFSSVAKIVLTLSHGNAFVESGFSVNEDMLEPTGEVSHLPTSSL